MKFFSKILIPLTLPLIVASCDSWEPDLLGRQGYLMTGAVDITVDTDEQIIARSETDISAYLVTINDHQGTPLASWQQDQLPDSVALSPGDYSMNVISHEPESLEWNRPLYKGSTVFSIKKDETTRVSPITCALAGAQVTVTFTDNVIDRFENPTVSVSQSSDIAAIFTPAEKRTACFNMINEGTSFIAEFTGTVDGTEVTLRQALADVKAGQHYILTFATKADGITPSIIVDANIKPPVDPNAPTITSSTIDINAVTTLTPENVADVKAIIDINAPRGIKELRVKIDSELLTAEALKDVGLAQEFDLAHPGDLAEALQSLGFPTGNEVLGKTSQVFDITPFLQLLVFFPGNNNFILTVVDNDGNSVEQAVCFFAAP